MYFSYVPRLVDFVADSDVESLVLSSFLPRICWPPYELDTDGIRNERGLVGIGNTAFEGLDFLK